MEYTFEQLKHMTVAELREIAKGIENEAVQGYTQLNKEHLLVAISKALGLQHEHHDVVGVDKASIKARMRELLDSARPLTIVREGYDRWGRTLAYVLAGETDAWLRFLTLTQRPNRPARVFWDQTLQALQAGVAK